MALTITPGAANAVSYADETYARTYFATTPRNSRWQALDADMQTAWLLEAMRSLEAQEYLGKRSNPIADTRQALEWPRKASHLLNRNSSTGGGSWEDRRGRTWEDDEIPDDIKKAQCEMALALAENDQYFNDRHKSRTISAGDVQIVFNTGKDLGTLCPLAYFLLQPFLTQMKGNGRVVRN